MGDNQNKKVSRFIATDALEALAEEVFLEIKSEKYSKVFLSGKKYASHYCQNQLIGKVLREKGINAEVFVCSNGLPESSNSDGSYVVDVDAYVEEYNAQDSKRV